MFFFSNGSELINNQSIYLYLRARRFPLTIEFFSVLLQINALFMYNTVVILQVIMILLTIF